MGASMKYLYLAGAFLISGCETLVSGKSLPQTLGEKNSSYSYVPIDPISITTEPGDSCGSLDSKVLFSVASSDKNKVSFEDLPQAFPDNTVRVAYKTVSANGSVTFGPVNTAQKGERYQIIIDFVNSDVTNQPFIVSKLATHVGRAEEDRFKPFTYLNPSDYPLERVRYEIKAISDQEIETSSKLQSIVNVPVYIGVGLRVIADVVTIKGDTKISGLGAISIAAENGAVNGSLVVQTLGINGKSITAAMPIQSDLNSTTVQNAIVAIGSIKALMYSDETTLKPRLLGLYNPLGGGEEVVNAFVSELSSNRTIWYRPCVGIHE